MIILAPAASIWALPAKAAPRYPLRHLPAVGGFTTIAGPSARWAARLWQAMREL